MDNSIIPTELEQVVEDREPQEVIRGLATRGHLPPTDQEKADALAWFLTPEDDRDLTHTIDINVGGPHSPMWIPWTIRPIDGDRLKQIRRRATKKLPGRRGNGVEEYDDDQANIAILIEGTVTPDLRAAARTLGMIDPSIGVRTRFSHKPGLIVSIVNEILSISGYDDDDVRDVEVSAKN